LLRIALADRIAGLAVALPRSALLAIAEAEARDLDLRHRDGDLVLALAADHLAVGDVLLEVLLDLALHDVAEAAVISLNVIDQTNPLSSDSARATASAS